MKYVFIDMDGTIAEWGYPDGRISGDYQFGDYFNKQPINDVIAEIYNLYSNSEEYIVYILSAVPNTKAIFEKNSWLDLNFIIPYENRIYIREDEDKVDIIKFVLDKFYGLEVDGNAILIDDKKEWLTKAAEAGIEVFHPTKIITSFQNRMAELKREEEQKVENTEGNEENTVENIIDESVEENNNVDQPEVIETEGIPEEN